METTTEVTAKFALGPAKTLYDKTYMGFRVHCYELTAHRVMVYSMYGYIIDTRIDSYLTDLLAAAKERRPTAMIADPRDMRVLSAPFQKAIQERFWPEIARLGIARNPAVAPSADITTSSVRHMISSAGQIVETAHGTVEVAMLPTLEICLRWALHQAGD